MQSRLHPTMKPLALVQKAIENSSREGESSMTASADREPRCWRVRRRGRRCRMMEVEAHYCDVILSRWEEATGKQAIPLQSSRNAENRTHFTCDSDAYSRASCGSLGGIGCCAGTARMQRK